MKILPQENLANREYLLFLNTRTYGKEITLAKIVLRLTEDWNKFVYKYGDTLNTFDLIDNMELHWKEIHNHVLSRVSETCHLSVGCTLHNYIQIYFTLHNLILHNYTAKYLTTTSTYFTHYNLILNNYTLILHNFIIHNYI